MSAESGLDWPGLMRAGLYGLKLQPVEFWALTPVELMVMLGREGGQAPISRARFEELAQSYPDSTGAPTAPGGGDG